MAQFRLNSHEIKSKPQSICSKYQGPWPKFYIIWVEILRNCPPPPSRKNSKLTLQTLSPGRKYEKSKNFKKIDHLDPPLQVEKSKKINKIDYLLDPPLHRQAESDSFRSVPFRSKTLESPPIERIKLETERI